MEVAAETAVQVRDPVWVAGNLVDRPLSELDGSWAGAGAAGELGGPCAEPTAVDGHEVGRVRHEVPQLERPLHVGACLGEGEHRLGAAARLDRCDERLGVATGGSPVDGQLRRSGGAGTLELLGDPAVEPLPLAGQDGGVHGLGEQRVAEPEAAPVGDEHAVVHGAPQGLVQVAIRQSGERPQQRVPDLTSRRRDQPKHVASGPVELGEAAQQQVPHATRQRFPRSRAGGEQLLGEERVARSTGDDRVERRRRR